MTITCDVRPCSPYRHFPEGGDRLIRTGFLIRSKCIWCEAPIIATVKGNVGRIISQIPWDTDQYLIEEDPY